MGLLGYLLSDRSIFFFVVALAIPTIAALTLIKPSEIDYEIARGADDGGRTVKVEKARALIKERPLLDGVGAGIIGGVPVLVIADLTRGSGRFNLALGAISTAVGIGASLSQVIAGSIVHRFGFIAGMFVVVRAIEETGLTVKLGNLLLHLSGGTRFGAVLAGTVASALGTNLINNVPMAVVMNSALGSVQHAAPALRNGFVAATIFGCDLGPNITIVGSLATIIWLLILRQRKLDVSGLDYFKVGVVVTPLMLLAGACTIWLCL
jgi:arsenical pump membrane protein